MDPLSITAGVLAFATFTAQIASLLAEIRADSSLWPGRLHALNNEIEDLNVVLHQVATTVEERKRRNLHGDIEYNIPGLLAQGREQLYLLKDVLDRLLLAGRSKRDAVFRTILWRKVQGRLAEIQNDIKRIKSSLNVLLGASNSQDMMRIRLELDQLSLVGNTDRTSDFEMSQKLLESIFERHGDKLSDLIATKYLQVDDRLRKVETLLQTQTTTLRTSQMSQIGPFYDPSRPEAKRRPTLPMSPASEEQIRTRAAAVGFRLRQQRTTCQASCPCSCHSLRRSASPSLLNRILGQLFLGYAGLPIVGNSCDSVNCQKGQIPSLNVEYWFPLGFCWSQIIRLQLAYESNVGPSLQLATMRRVSDSAQCVSFALDGNIDGLKSLFGQGMASPRDVSSTRGYSLLRWALYGQQYETCKFLMTVGADPTYAPIASSDQSPSDKACDVILRGGLPPEVVDILRIISDGSDFIERQNFSAIHKIALGLSFQDLEEYLHDRPEDVDLRDATGRTALQWSAARGDERSVVTLLSYGADANNMDTKLNTPLTLAANQNHTTCVRLLLEAGALPDPPIPPGVKFGTPLNCAARNAGDPMLMKTLLDFEANIEASGVDGVTPLLHVARGNSAVHAMLLLEYGANINATSKTGQTPLTAAIQHNNHAVLKLLLSRWFEYSECPRLKGPNLLEGVAQYADAETMAILSAAEHLRARVDVSYILSHYTEILQARIDTSDALIAAFGDLISVLKAVAGPLGSVQSRMESGLLSPFETLGIEDDDDSDSDLLVFEDAKESLHPAPGQEFGFCPVRGLEKSATM